MMNNWITKVSVLTLAAFLLAAPALAGSKAKAKEDETAKKKAQEASFKRKIILAGVHPYIHRTFERKNSEKDLVHGFITHSKPMTSGEKHVAFVHIQWGDLNKELSTISKEFYSNWTGYVDFEAGHAYVVKEFAFDDGSPRPGNKLSQRAHNHKDKFVASAKAARDKALASAQKIPDRSKRLKVMGEIKAKYSKALKNYNAKADEKIADAKENRDHRSGRDELIGDGDRTKVTWMAGTVGATDGLLIRLESPQAKIKGVIQVGRFKIPFVIQPVPGNKAEALAAQAEKAVKALETGKAKASKKK